ncbi:S9 family peptidase, partial [candidate division CSSED10-310 bacterium]
GYKMWPSFSPDGHWIAYYGAEGKDKPWQNMGLWITSRLGDGNPRNLTQALDLDVAGPVINDLPEFPTEVPPTWSRDGKNIYFAVGQKGTVTLNQISWTGKNLTLQPIIANKGTVGAFFFDQQQSKLAYYYGDLSDPGQLFVKDLHADKTRKLTHLNESLIRNRDLGEIEEIWFPGPAENNLHGWILKPPGFDPTRKYPSILEIHGGPRVHYGNLFMHEFYFLAANDYIVYFCNPRGSQGYGEEHAKAIWNNWGSVDYDDVMAWVDFVSEKPYFDPQKMGVTGGSYGGYMTNWIVSHSNRFQAAVTQRSVSNLISMYGSSDFNWGLQREFGDTPPWENLENYWRQSPLKYIENVKTPTLVIHSERDDRAPIEQGEQFFVALKKLGVDTELLLFPDEPHGLSRMGRTDRRIARLKNILRWFNRYLK